MADSTPPDFGASDRAASVWFVLARLGYGRFIGRLCSTRGIAGRLRGIRRVWMSTVLGRDNRITDASPIGHTVHSATSFASTAAVALAVPPGLLGDLDRTHAALAGPGAAAETSRATVEAKPLLLAFVLAHTFLEHGWSLRRLNDRIAPVGAAPVELAPLRRAALAGRISAALSAAPSGFNAGIRGHHFALAALAWSLGPGAFAAATAGIVVMLLRRQFASEAAEAIRLGHAVLCDDTAADEHDDPLARGRPAGRGAWPWHRVCTLFPFPRTEVPPCVPKRSAATCSWPTCPSA